MSEAIPLQRPALNLSLQALPPLWKTYPRGLWGAAQRQQGRVYGTPHEMLIKLDNFTIDLQETQAFATVCGVELQTVGTALLCPPTWPEAWFNGMMTRLIVDPTFPLCPLGILHIEQFIHQHHPLTTGMTVQLRCMLRALSQTDRGIEARMGMEVWQATTLMWEGEALFLSRGKASSGRQRPADVALSDGQPLLAPADTGRAYAGVTGDYNPHHLWPWSARLVGFKRPIAHGMWTMARALAMQAAQVGPLPASFRLHASFKRPLELPGESRFFSETKENGHLLRVMDPKTGAPQLILEIGS